MKPALRIAGNQGSGLHDVVSRKEGCATYVQAANEAVDSLEALVPALFAFDIPGSLAAVEPALCIAELPNTGLHRVADDFRFFGHIFSLRDILLRPFSLAISCFSIWMVLHLFISISSILPSLLIGSAPLSSTYASAFCLSSLFGSAVYNFVSGSKNSFRSLAVTAGSTAVGFFGGSFLEQVYLSACVLLASD